MFTLVETAKQKAAADRAERAAAAAAAAAERLAKSEAKAAKAASGAAHTHDDFNTQHADANAKGKMVAWWEQVRYISE